ncbi:MAG: GFA family protein [Pseudoruegeria sp.]
MIHFGSCLCGAVTYEVKGEMRPVSACHCGQCRKTSGHYWAATQVPDDALILTNKSGLTWFKSSDWAERGFCNQCGSSLFWRMPSEGKTSIAAGSLDDSADLSIDKHIFVADKGGYYDIEAGPEQIDKY